jgi:large subunit ribosomal protein L30
VTGTEKPKARGGKGQGKTLTLRLIRSGISTPRRQRETLRGLGFRRIGQEVVREDGPAVRGMIHKVRHLVEVVKD